MHNYRRKRWIYKRKTYILYSVLNRGEFIKLKRVYKNNRQQSFYHRRREVREVLGEGFGELLNED